MGYEIINKDKITLVGIEVRTTNESGKAMVDIGGLWQKFYSENLPSIIENKADDSIIALYTEYESDYTKPYTCMIGCSINEEGNNIAENMVLKVIPSAKYAVFTAKSNAPEDIFAVWQYIWNSDLKRTYSGDFEVYDNNVQGVKIYIAVE